MFISKDSLKKFLILHCVYSVLFVATEFCFLSTFTVESPLSDFLTLFGIMILLGFNLLFLICLDKKMVCTECMEQNNTGLP